MTGSLASVHPELIPEWSEKNLPLTPDKITFGSNKRVWWKGACGHEWETSVKARSKGEKCPICSGARVIEGINDLATLKPLLAQEWSKKNKLKPTEVSVASHKKIIWKCKHGHEWEASVKSRTVNGTGCPYCSHNKVLAGFNDLASQYPNIAAEWSDRNLPLLPTMVTAFANSNVLKELKQSHCFQTEKRRALTRPEQELLLSYLKNTPSASLWYPIFAVLIGTGLRVGEATGLRWCDIDLEEGIIDVNHTLVYYDHRTEGSKRGCYFNINTTKTPAGKRQVPMLDFVKEAFLMEKERQELLDIHCEAVVDGYTDFIFLNRFGQPQHQATLNKAIRRIIRDCNDEQLLKDENAKILLPHFSCHSLRHTFTTRMCEAGVNVKVIQDTLGHKDISTTLNIYTDVTKELRRSEFEGLDSYFKNEYNKAANI